MVMARALFLTNGGHIRLPGNRFRLDDLLRRQARLAVTECDDNSLLTVAQLADFDVIIDYGGDNRNELTDAQIEALLAAVDAGTPFVGLHAASLPFRSQLSLVQQSLRQHGGTWLSAPKATSFLSDARRRYFAMLGSAFITHPPVKTFTVQIADRSHPITRGGDDFEIEDEQYEIGGDWSRQHVLASANGHPLIYVSQWGKGKVHYNALGHTDQALGHPSYQQLLLQALDWALS